MERSDLAPERATPRWPSAQPEGARETSAAKDTPQENMPPSQPQSLSETVPTTTDDLAAQAIEEKEHAGSITARNSSEGQKTESDNEAPSQPTAAHDDRVYSVIPRRQKVVIILLVSFAALFSPLTSAIYLPAMTSIAKDLNVETSLINLTITTYQIMQGIAPSFIGTLSDNKGRRLAYVTTFSIYMIANLALALQNTYPALLVLRCLQSAGSSATIALSAATVADLVTRAERGTWQGYATLGTSLGPALGPVIGGLLDQYLGWHWIFWFLLIMSGIVTTLMFLILPETGRAVVGNGSVPPKKWNLSVLQWWRLRRGTPIMGGEPYEEDRSTIQKPRRRPNPLTSLLILLEKEGGITLGFGGIFFAGYFMIMTTLSEQLSTRFGFNSVTVGLCYLPIGFGSLISRWSAGRLFDLNFRRHARKLGLPLDLNRQQAIEVFPIERIRMEVCIPMVYISCATTLAYAWTMESNSSLPKILVCLFFMGLFFSGVQQGFNTLIIDTHSDTPATATAANNLVRCLVSAGGTAIAPFLIKKIGIGLTGVFISGVWVCFSPCLWMVMLRGKKWREEEKAKQAKKEALEREKEGHRV